jgi:hypothetical protein
VRPRFAEIDADDHVELLQHRDFLPPGEQPIHDERQAQDLEGEEREASDQPSQDLLGFPREPVLQAVEGRRGPGKGQDQKDLPAEAVGPTAS